MNTKARVEKTIYVVVDTIEDSYGGVNERDAIEKAKAIPLSEWKIAGSDKEYVREDELYKVDRFVNAVKYRKLLELLESFHGSECEKEWLDIDYAWKHEPKSVVFRKLADFFEKGEYKKYGGYISSSLDDISLTISVSTSEGGASRFYSLSRYRKYDIEDDIKRLKEKIAEADQELIVANDRPLHKDESDFGFTDDNYMHEINPDAEGDYSDD